MEVHMSGFMLATLGFIAAMSIPALLVAAAESVAVSSLRGAVRSN
jgi:hypothetical protein